MKAVTDRIYRLLERGDLGECQARDLLCLLQGSVSDKKEALQRIYGIERACMVNNTFTYRYWNPDTDTYREVEYNLGADTFKVRDARRDRRYRCNRGRSL